MASVFKRTHTAADGTVFTSKIWRIEYTDEKGKRITVAGYKDKRSTDALAAQLENNAARVRAGLPPKPLTDAAKDPHRQRAYEATVEAYLTHLRATGGPRNGLYCYEVGRCLGVLQKRWQWTRLGHIQPDQLTAYRAELVAAGRSARTCNHYHEVLRAFLNFCVAQHWLDDSPIDGIKVIAYKEHMARRRRRAYTVAELQRLLAIAPEPRRTIYAIAAFSGLRRSELAQLQKGDATPLGSAPRWHIRGAITKNGKPAYLPMLPDCAAWLLPVWTPAKAPESLLFPARPAGWTAMYPRTRTLYRDLLAAGIRRINPDGRRLDFHSFRYFFCKELGERLPIQKVKTLMRHSTIKLTADLYGQLGMEDVAEAVWTLPPLLGTAGTVTPTVTGPSQRPNTLPFTG